MMDLKEFKRRMRRSTSEQERVSLFDAYAEVLFEKEKYVDARKYYTEALAVEKGQNARAYFEGRIGICHYNLGNDAYALKHLQKSVHLFDPAKPEFMNDMYGFIHFHLGSIYEYQGKVSKSLEARQVCEKYIESQEKDTKWMLYAGISRNYETLGKHDEAIRYYQKAIQILSDDDPGLAYLYESMANNHMQMKEYSEAVKHYSKVLELDPNFERKDEIQLRVAECYQQLTNDRMALETYKQILELKQLTGKRENLTWLYAKIAYSHFVLEQYESSLLMTLEALRRKQKNNLGKAEIRSFLTDNYYELGRYREAVEEGEGTLKLAKQFPNCNLFYFRLALSYFKLGDKRNFTKYRRICRRMFPEDSWNNYLDKLM